MPPDPRSFRRMIVEMALRECRAIRVGEGIVLSFELSDEQFRAWLETVERAAYGAPARC